MITKRSPKSASNSIWLYFDWRQLNLCQSIWLADERSSTRLNTDTHRHTHMQTHSFSNTHGNYDRTQIMYETKILPNQIHHTTHCIVPYDQTLTEMGFPALMNGLYRPLWVSWESDLAKEGQQMKNLTPLRLHNNDTKTTPQTRMHRIIFLGNINQIAATVYRYIGISYHLLQSLTNEITLFLEIEFVIEMQVLFIPHIYANHVCVRIIFQVKSTCNHNC